MKVVKTKTGWDEIETTRIKLIMVVRNFNSLEKWLDFIKRNPKMKTGRVHCHCCNAKFANKGLPIALAFTDKGNRPICDECAIFFEQNGVKTRDHTKLDDNEETRPKEVANPS